MEFEIITDFDNKVYTLEEAIESTERGIAYFKKDEENDLNIIRTKIGNPSACMVYLSKIYIFNAKLALLKYQDVDKFKENMYITGKLFLMSQEKINFFITGYPTEIFPIIMSNNVEMREFLIKNMDRITYWDKVKEYGLTGVSGIIFQNRNILLALKGDFKQLRERSAVFVEKFPKSEKKRVIDHEFYIALCDGNIEEMRKVIYRMLEKKTARKMMWDVEVFFNDFLHIHVLLYSKIALLHGYDLGIDHIKAPKELIDNTPLESYPEPYDFMEGFRFDFTEEDWKKWIEENKSLKRRNNY